MILNSNNVQIYQNTFVNSMVCIGRNERSAQGDHFGWHPSTGPDVDKREGHIFVNNLLTGIEDFDRSLLFVWQPASLCNKLTQSQLELLDHNVYVRSIDKAVNPLILWSPATNEKCQIGFDSLSDMIKLYPEFSINSYYYNNYHGPLFKGAELGNYQLLPDFQESKFATQLPEEISKYINPRLKDEHYVGAYPPAQ